MKHFLNLEVPPLEVSRELQQTFCKVAKKCTEEKSCKACLYAKENIKIFEMRFKELEK